MGLGAQLAEPMDVMSATELVGEAGVGVVVGGGGGGLLDDEFDDVDVLDRDVVVVDLTKVVPELPAGTLRT